jgi:hypothetical protein
MTWVWLCTKTLERNLTWKGHGPFSHVFDGQFIPRLASGIRIAIVSLIMGPALGQPATFCYY